MANDVIFKVGTRAQYDAIVEKDPFALYWLIDEQSLYKGDQLFSRGTAPTQNLPGLLSYEDKLKIDSISGGLSYIGMTTRQPGETDLQAIARYITSIGHTPVSGDIIIVNTAEYIYNGSSWEMLGDQNLWATKASLTAETNNRINADQNLQDQINRIVPSSPEILTNAEIIAICQW